MGIVYKAEDIHLKRTVALKFLPEEYTGVREAKKRFIQEAQAAAALNHPNIVTVYEINEYKGQIYIAMEYVQGETLKEMLARSGNGMSANTDSEYIGEITDYPLQTSAVIDIAIQTCKGLATAHDNGIIHRDIKPGNIIITREGQVKIVDFGLAKLAGGEHITASGSTLGTYAYMSPEQIKGEKLDFRTDIWSLGIMIYEMLTGEVPFTGEYEAAILYSIVNDQHRPAIEINRDIPTELNCITECCLVKEPEKRYQDIYELLKDLEDINRKNVQARVKVFGAGKRQYYRTPFKKKHLPVLLGLLLASLALWILISPPVFIKNFLGISSIPNVKHLVILPFKVHGGDSDCQAFSLGLRERLFGCLIQLEKFYPNFWVIPTSMVRSYGVSNPHQAQQILGANVALVGSIRRIGNMVDFEINLFDGKSQRRLDTHKFSDHLANIDVWQNGILYKVLEMLELENKPEVASFLRSVYTAVPEVFEIYLTGLGYMYRSSGSGKTERVIHLLSKAIQKDPVYPLAFAALGKAYYLKFTATKELQWQFKALDHYSRAINLCNHYLPFHISLGKIYRGLGQYEKARRQFRHSLTFDPNNYFLVRELAITYDEAELLKEAENAYKKAIDLRPNFFDGYVNFGYFLSYHGRFKEAEEMFKKVTRLSKQNTLAFNNLGAIYSQTGQMELAVSSFQKSLRIEANADALSNLGTLYFFQGKYADALLMFEEAVKLAQHDYIIWGNLVDTYRFVPGYSKKVESAYNRAIELSRDQLAITPRDAKLRSSLAVYYAKCGKVDPARREIAKAREISPSDVSVLFKVILVAEMTDSRNEAIHAAKEFLESGGSIKQINKDPDLSGLIADPRFQKIAEPSVKSEGEM